MPTSYYPGVGADEEIAKLERLVGKITASWALVEGALFHLFVIAVAGTWAVGNLLPYRAVFFTFSAYEGKMRMLHNAMKARFNADATVMSEWVELRKRIDGFSQLRNEVAHLFPMVVSSPDPAAKGNVRLMPPVWKGSFREPGSVKTYSLGELTEALAPFWSYDPSLNIFDTPRRMIGYELQQFAIKLEPHIPPGPTPSLGS
jgi:hypothetical protein